LWVLELMPAHTRCCPSQLRDPQGSGVSSVYHFSVAPERISSGVPSKWETRI
jgi:hypothetical protein